MRTRTFIVAWCAVAIACAEPEPSRPPDGPCQSPRISAVVERFGNRLSDVSLLAPADRVQRQIGAAYAPLVTPALLDAWISKADGGAGPFRVQPVAGAHRDPVDRGDREGIAASAANSST